MDKGAKNDDVEGKISYKDIYDTLWRCRDFELSHLWQRSVFLTAFLTLCYIGYGYLIHDIIFVGASGDRIVYAKGLAFCIALVGLVISYLWVIMARGSKYWFESYEQAIDLFSAQPKAFCDRDVAKLSGSSPCRIINTLHVTSETISCGSDDKPRCGKNWMDLSTNAGKYSVSRINIFIGIVSVFIWLALCLAHILLAFDKYAARGGLKQLVVDMVSSPVGMVLLLVLTLIGGLVSGHCFLKSSDAK